MMIGTSNPAGIFNNFRTYSPAEQLSSWARKRNCPQQLFNPRLSAAYCAVIPAIAQSSTQTSLAAGSATITSAS